MQLPFKNSISVQGPLFIEPRRHNLADNFIVGLDIGTSSTRAVVGDFDEETSLKSLVTA